MKTLTRREKSMNMAKLGTVSALGNYFHSTGNPRKQRAGGMMRYTLCEYLGKARNSSRVTQRQPDLPASTQPTI